MTFPRFRPRDLMTWDIETARTIPEVHEIEFDDGEVLVCCGNETVYTLLFWSIFKPYPSVKILKKHHIVSVLKGEALDTGSHTKLCSEILKTIVLSEGLYRPETKEPLLSLILDTVSVAQGWLSILTVRDVTSIDILDFVQIAQHPGIVELKNAARKDPKRIKYVYEEVEKIIMTDPNLDENGLAKAVRSKMVKTNQVTQCVAFRGFSTEVDGTIFPLPVWGNYTQGNRTFYDYVADSRLAAKSHFYSDTALKDSEYSARRFQLFAMTLERINWTDCKTKRHTPWLVRGAEYDADKTTTYPSDLPNLIGKWYKETLDENEPYKIIEGKEEHLWNKTIYLRTTICCETPNPHEVCHVCAGELSHNIPKTSNLGHLGAVSTTKEFTQNILSIKHVNTSSMVLKVKLGDHERMFLNTGPEGSAFFVNESLRDLDPSITVVREELPGLVDLKNIETLAQIGLPRISCITSIGIGVNVSKNASSRRDVSVNTVQRGKPTMLSREFLGYIKGYGWEMDKNNNFIFNLKEWDFSKPIIILGNKEESFVDLANQANLVVRSNQKEIDKRTQPNAATLLLQELFTLVNTKLKVNILALEFIVYPLMVKSKTSYELARGTDSQLLGIAEILTKFRTAGPALAYEDQGEFLTEATNFFPGNRPDSPMDVFLCPREVVEAEQQRIASTR